MESDPALLWIQAVLDKHEVSIATARDFAALCKYEIALILDDSGSMASSSSSGLTWDNVVNLDFGAASGTRWDELRVTAQQVIDIAAAFSPDGVNVHFLNTGKIPAVRCGDDARLESRFALHPRGGTPLTETLHTVLTEHSGRKPLLVVICTDGLPNGGVGKMTHLIEDSIRESSGHIRYALLACTDDDSAVSWMNQLDYRYTEVDTTDDYQTERAEVMRRGIYDSFKRGDWLAKALLGPISKKFDCADEFSPASSPARYSSHKESFAKKKKVSIGHLACAGCPLQ